MVARTNFTAVLGVVVEVLVGHDAVFITDQPVRSHLRWIEVDLDLDILGNRDQRRAHLVDQHLVRFLRCIDIGIVAVALAGECFQGAVLEVAHAEAEHGQEHLALGLGLDQRFEIFALGDAHVEIAISGKNDAVGPFAQKVLGGDVVGELDTRAAVGRALGDKLVNPGNDLGLAVAWGRAQELTRGAGVDDDRYPILDGELLDQLLERPLHQRQLVGCRHRAGNVNQEDEVAGRPAVLIDGPARDADAGQPVFGVPWAAGDLGVDRERIGIARKRGRVLIGKIVDQLLDANRITRGKLVHGEQVAADVGVAGGVDVDGEGRLGLVQSDLKGVLLDLVEALAIGLVESDCGLVDTEWGLLLLDDSLNERGWRLLHGFLTSVSLGLLSRCGLLRSVLSLPFFRGAEPWKGLAIGLLRGTCGQLIGVHFPRWDAGSRRRWVLAGLKLAG